MKTEKRLSAYEAAQVLRIGGEVLESFRQHIGPEEFDKVMSEPMPPCKCGKNTDEICPECEVQE